MSDKRQEALEAAAKALYYLADDGWIWEEDVQANRDDYIKEAQACIEAYEQVMGWQPIESAPKDWSDLLLATYDPESDEYTMCVGYYSMADGGDDCWYMTASAGQTFVYPTHWRPLPQPPINPSEGR